VHGAQARYVGTFTGPAWTAYLGDRVLALSGLTPWTQGGKHAFGLAFMHEIAKRSGKPGTSSTRCCAKLQQYGIGEEHWDIIGARRSTSARAGWR
jgi:hypothetical protein